MLIRPIIVIVMKRFPASTVDSGNRCFFFFFYPSFFHSFISLFVSVIIERVLLFIINLMDAVVGKSDCVSLTSFYLIEI